jgi:hypothetical protein
MTTCRALRLKRTNRKKLNVWPKSVAINWPGIWLTASRKRRPFSLTRIRVSKVTRLWTAIQMISMVASSLATNCLTIAKMKTVYSPTRKSLT